MTHDIEEAVLLADRVLLLEHGTIGAEFTVELERPRDRTTAAFQDLTGRILNRVLGSIGQRAASSDNAES